MRALLVVGTSQLWGGENPCKAREFMRLDLTRSDLSMIITTIFTDPRCFYFRVLSRHLRRRLLIVPPRSLCWAWAEPSDFDLNQFATPPMPSVSAFMNCEFNHPIWCRINLARSRLSWVSSFLHRKSITVGGMQGTRIFKFIRLRVMTDSRRISSSPRYPFQPWAFEIWCNCHQRLRRHMEYGSEPTWL